MLFPNYQTYERGKTKSLFQKSSRLHNHPKLHANQRRQFQDSEFHSLVNNKDYTTESFNIIVNSPNDDSAEENEIFSPEKAKSNAFLA